MVLEWSAGNQPEAFTRITTSNLRDDPIGAPSPGFGGLKRRTDTRRAGINSDKASLLTLKTFQRNQMHGNFSDLVTSVVSTEEISEHAETEDS